MNIKQFEKYDENDPDEKDLIRHGSSNDVTNLSQVLRALGYTIWKEDEIAGKKEKWYKDVSLYWNNKQFKKQISLK